VRGRFGGEGFDRRGPQNRESGERTGSRADERGPQNSERRCAPEEISADKSAPLGSERERGERAGAGWCRQAGTTCQREAGARGGGGLDGPIWAVWAKIRFSIFLEFQNAFLFLFSLGIQIKFKHQFKYFQTCASQKNNLGST
jgi:hypothetical protein